MSITLLDNASPVFPDAACADTDGLLSIGGNLKVQTLLNAYRCGIFPWFETGQPLLWWSPDPRLVLQPEALHISRSLRKSVRSDFPRVELNCAFREVIAACAAPRAGSCDTWITADMREAYIRLHDMNYAHSMEVYDRAGALAGGLYGVGIGRMFFGESMFSRKNNASKTALFHLCAHTQAHQLPLIDCQVESGHLQSLGAVAMPRGHFIDRVAQLCGEAPPDGLWRPQRLCGDDAAQREQEE